MTTSDRRRARGAFARRAAIAFLLSGLGSAGATEVRVGGSAGFGLTAVRPPGAFRWDFDSAQEDTTLAVLKFGANAGPLSGFVALGAGLGPTTEPELQFELREASLTGTQRWGDADSLAVRLFARQPQSLWVGYLLTPPLATWAAGGDDATGVRADAACGRGSATLVAGWRGVLDGSVTSASPPVGTVEPPAEDFVLLRLGGDASRWAGLRFGATWKRVHPAALFASGPEPVDSGHRDLLEFDTRLAWRGMQACVEYAHAAAAPIHSFGTSPGGSAAPGIGMRSSGPLTRALSTHDALRAELRCASLVAGRWGVFGFAPQYRALGRDYVDRLAASERDVGAPRRGVEGYRLEAWFALAAWPGWVRQVYDRHQQFQDADRRVIVQQSECVVPLTPGLRARALYVQCEEFLPGRAVRVYHDDLLGELAAAAGGLRCRVQVGVAGLNSPASERVVAVEAGAPLGQRLQAVARTAFAAGPASTRRSLFVELQYWHLPQFELAVQYGPEWIGDTVLPALDADLTADGSQIDRFRLHFRGWF